MFIWQQSELPMCRFNEVRGLLKKPLRVGVVAVMSCY